MDKPVSGKNYVHTTVDQAVLDQHDVVLPLQLIPRTLVRGSVGHATVHQQQQPHSQMPSQTCVNSAVGPAQVSFLFQI